MKKNRKVLVVMSEEMILSADRVAASENTSRSEIFRRALKLYLLHKHRMEVREKMRRGYEQMAHINMEWAELGMEDPFSYEVFLAECEKIND